MRGETHALRLYRRDNNVNFSFFTRKLKSEAAQAIQNSKFPEARRKQSKISKTILSMKKNFLFLLAAGAASAQAVASGATGKLHVDAHRSCRQSHPYHQRYGGMADSVSYNAALWRSYRSNIKTLTIQQGVASIGSCAFYGCSGLISVTISSVQP
jgi:hypothetical protein